MELGIAGRSILITGAAQGVGRQLALAAAAEGAHVLLHYHRSEEQAASVAAEIRAHGGSVDLFQADLADYDAVVRMGEEIRSRTDLYGIVNNAGWAQYKRLFAYQPGEWKREIEVCYLGLIHLVHALVPDMIARSQGKVINIVGESARTGDRSLIISASARGAAISFMKSLAQEVGPHHIQCNTVSLGVVEKPESPFDDATAQKIRRLYPAGRLGVPSDVAAMVLFLLSQQAEWVTGQLFAVNGGYTMMG
ncbi:SDR family oxidoreductase [Alicyclobacillus cycloheptanicus]|uniref:NAD(P)-dependent dehydrogenase (Short-subunit alcohol dehydrogenase family) n=1 Tax=Alicyclobacillus cycloheptanicus TaxID=1457 RepID=A0ABT9XFN2_9BACL|nr:SDR family oxidoreductase [Alicyclobacillus cycloheptanicus]MDQ0188930.1 NAD(P)-dependent dehydrogenase (short-subunit alcohol dehydrogenase family) [Alicyclobacillus cycloheptanicus]WDM01721.1 SDR family oxidoreductase [Alicyclobacillus cycloheptanicus]